MITTGRRAPWLALTALGLACFPCTPLDAQTQTGKLVGHWENTTFGSFGPVEVYFSLGLAGFTLRVESGGPALGSTEPLPPLTLSGPITLAGGEVTLEDHPRFGDVTAALLPTGEITAVAPDIPAPGFASASFEGTLTLDGVEGAYRIEFATDTPEAERVEGIDYAVGKLQAGPESPPRFEWVYPLPTGDDLFDLTIGEGAGGDPIAVAVGRSLVVRTGGAFVEPMLPPRIFPARFLGAAWHDDTFAAFDERGQVYRSADGVRWDEAGRLPEGSDFRDVAPGTAAGRFTFVGAGGLVSEFPLGTWAEPLEPAVTWDAPGAPDLTYATPIGDGIGIGGADGTVAHWTGNAGTASVETIADATGLTVTGLARGGGKLVAVTRTEAGGAGSVFRRPAGGGAWADAGFAFGFDNVAYHASLSRFLFASSERRYFLTGDDLVPPEFPIFTPYPITSAAPAGDHFYLSGEGGGFASVSGDGVLTDRRERWIEEWPLYDMARAGDQLLLFTRFGRYFASSNGFDFEERFAFGGFGAPSLSTAVTLDDGTVLAMTNERPASATTADGVSWNTFQPLLDPNGMQVNPWMIDSAVNSDGVILGLSSFQNRTGIWKTTAENPDTFELVDSMFSAEQAILAAGSRFFRLGNTIRESPNGIDWSAVGGVPAGTYTAGLYAEDGDFIIAGTSTGLLLTYDLGGVSVAASVRSPFTSRVDGFAEADDGRIFGWDRDGHLAESRGGDFEVVDRFEGTYFGGYQDLEAGFLFLHGADGKLMRLRTGEGEGGGTIGPKEEWEEWRGTHFTNAELQDPQVSGPYADPDRDGNVNLMELIAGTDPRQHSAPPPVETGFEGGEPYAEWQLPASSLSFGSIGTQWSLDLQAWFDGPDPTITEDGATIRVRSRLETPFESGEGYIRYQFTPGF